MNLHPSSEFFSDLSAGLQSPGLLMQVLVLIIGMAVAWRLSRWLVSRFTPAGDAPASPAVPVDSFHRVLAPLLAVVFVALAVPAVGNWQSAAVLRAALPMLLAFLLIRTVFFLLRKAFVKEGQIGRVLHSVEQAIATLVWLGLLLYATGLWPGLIQLLEETTLPIGRHRESLLVIVQALISVAVTVVIALWAAAVLEQRLMRFDAVHSSVRVVLARAGRALLLLLAVLVSLSLVGIDLTVLSVFGGALGVGLGLGLQKLVSSYVSGVVILLDRSLALGDIISVDKYRGEVVQINARCTVLRASDGSEAAIPNEMMVSSPVQNFSQADRNARVSTLLMVAQDADIDSITTSVVGFLLALPRVLAEPAPAVQIRRIAPEGLELEILFSIADPEHGSGGLVSALNSHLLSLIRSAHIPLTRLHEKESPVRG